MTVMSSVFNPSAGHEPTVTSSTATKRAVGRQFGRAAASYDAHAVLQLSCARSLLAMAPESLPIPRAADLGCATAPLSRQQQERWHEVRWLALDLAPAMLQEASQRGRTGRLFSPVCADAEALPLPDRSLGLVFSSFALQWCDPAVVIAEAGRVLAPGGHLLLAVPLRDSLRELSESWKAADRRPHVNDLPTMVQWHDALATEGLSTVTQQTLTVTQHYPDVRAIARTLKATGADHVQGGGGGLTGKRAFRTMLDAYETLRTRDGLPLTWRVLFLHASKEVL